MGNAAMQSTASVGGLGSGLGMNPVMAQPGASASMVPGLRNPLSMVAGGPGMPPGGAAADATLDRAEASLEGAAAAPGAGPGFWGNLCCGCCGNDAAAATQAAEEQAVGGPAMAGAGGPLAPGAARVGSGAGLGQAGGLAGSYGPMAAGMGGTGGTPLSSSAALKPGLGAAAQPMGYGAG